MVGGMAALVGAAMVGPRHGRFDKDGQAVTIHGHTVPVRTVHIFDSLFFICNYGSSAMKYT